jgi:hypothetical protein
MMVLYITPLMRNKVTIFKTLYFRNKNGAGLNFANNYVILDVRNVKARLARQGR